MIRTGNIAPDWLAEIALIDISRLERSLYAGMNAMILFEKTDNPFAATYHVRDIVGYIPNMLDEWDDRSAKEQIDRGYAHGGGWRSMTGFEFDSEKLTLKYPDDPIMHALAVGKLHEETIYVYDYGFVQIVQPDGSWEVARID